jgi:hypothetical protein
MPSKHVMRRMHWSEGILNSPGLGLATSKEPTANSGH